MPALSVEQLQHMRDQVFFEGPDRRRRLSRFWLLLTFATIIATAGVVGDSTATVIGAMIVAPLMTPILGLVLAIVLGSRPNLIRCGLLTLGGSAAVVSISWVLGHAWSYPINAATSSQVALRVAPRLVDLLAALGSGAVGSIALARPDISDTLPGVAIAISLVPPLAVVGLTAESGAYEQSGQALLLFAANVVAILASGVVVMAIYRARQLASPGGATGVLHRSYSALVIAALLVLVAVPLGTQGIRVARQTNLATQASAVADQRAAHSGWLVQQVTVQNDKLFIQATGPLPEPSLSALRSALDATGLSATEAAVELIPGHVVILKPK